MFNAVRFESDHVLQAADVRRHSLTLLLTTILVTTALLTGCQRPDLFASDAFVIPGDGGMLSASIVRGQSPDTCRGIPGVTVRFYHGDQLLGEATTGDCGTARLESALLASATNYRAEALFDGQSLSAEGAVFNGSPNRTVIICDIDGTISDTHYRELVFDEEDRASQPLPGAVETLNELRKHYGLIYVTARPGFLRAKTQRWLRNHGFPEAPLIGTPGLAQSIRPDRFKAETIARLQTSNSTIRIGIGDARTDSEAYGMTDLLPIIVDDNDNGRFRAHAIVLRDWKMIREFFDVNAEVLQDPDRLHRVIEQEDLLKRPTRHYQPTRHHTHMADDPAEASPRS